MPDLVFPPSILKRYKEFIVESAVATPIPSQGAIAAAGSDSTLLGTVPMGVLQATTYPVVAHYLNAKFQAGGKTGDGITGFILGCTRDVTKNANTVGNGLFSTSLPKFANGDALSKILSDTLAGILSGTAVTTQDKLDAFTSPFGIPIGDTLAYDVYFVRQGNGVAPQDPGLWTISTFSCTQAVLLFGPVPVPPT